MREVSLRAAAKCKCRKLPTRAGFKLKKIAVLLRSNADEWIALLRAALPRHIIVGDAAEAADAAYAVVGKPAPGALAALRELQIVFSVNAGVEALLESGEVPEGIPIVRMVDDGLAEGMLEWVLATTLAWHRNLFAYRDRQLQGAWAPLREVLARNRRVTVLGAGHLGGRVAAALAQIGFDTRVWSRTSKQIPGVESLSGEATLHGAVKEAEILINLLPLTPATEDLLDAPLLAQVAHDAVLINAGRGRHVVDQAVLELLDSGRLRAAVLDVFREEPLPQSHPFWRHPGVYLTPHVAAPTHASTAVAAIAENLRGFESGASLRHVVDLSRGY
jgi:glyoxylate/hydroxypyruvate reductase A